MGSNTLAPLWADEACQRCYIPPPPPPFRRRLAYSVHPCSVGCTHFRGCTPLHNYHIIFWMRTMHTLTFLGCILEACLFRRMGSTLKRVRYVISGTLSNIGVYSQRES